jgi:predicted AAA+ superfamily ATPase
MHRAYSLLHADLISHLKQYLYVGGMPQSARTFIKTGDLRAVRTIQRDILHDFERDFSKHINASSIPKVAMIWNSIPLHLGKEKKQFIYKELKQGARASQFEDAMRWLILTGLAYQLHRVETPNLPLSAYKQDAFKLFMLDVGLLSAMTRLEQENLSTPDSSMFKQFRGALTEQFVMQELAAMSEDMDSAYWANDRSKGLAELDFVVQYKGDIIPIEAKASVNLKAKSLKTYMDYYKPKAAIRTSLEKYSRNGALYDIPLYAIGWLL